MAIILGIDPGLATMGFGYLQTDPISNTVKALDYGVVATPAGTPISERLKTLYEDLSTLLSRTKPDQVGLEKLFFYKMGNTIQVAQARGVILLALIHYQLIPQEFTPAQIKQSLTGYGNSDKRAIQESVTRELGLTHIPRPDDAADALAIALTVWHRRFTALDPE